MRPVEQRTYDAWQLERTQNQSWVELVNDAMPSYERTRLRDADEAQLLRERETPEFLIGPTRL